ERSMAARYNREGFPIVDHRTFVLCSDGDLMEGVAYEAASFAGHQRLGKLICLHDDNHISIEGETELAFTEDIGKRFRAYGWHVDRVRDGNDMGSISAAIKEAMKEDRPSFISVRTHIGFGSPKQDSASAHGAPLGADASRITKEFYGWPVDKSFFIPDDVRLRVEELSKRGGGLAASWQELFENYVKSYPDEAKCFERDIASVLCDGLEMQIPEFSSGEKIATRSASGKVINSISSFVPNLIGGSADLSPSNNTDIFGASYASHEFPEGRNIHYGVREHAMAAITNGISLHAGLIPYCGTFLVFSDYMRPAIRLAAIMDLHSIFIFTHDSIGVGEDGPTHQPIEHLMSLRTIPGLFVIRPADANETSAAWKFALECKSPVAMILSRQNLPVLPADEYPVHAGVARGGYILKGRAWPDLILMATGSEVHLALAAAEILEKKDLNVRVVSMPSWKIFEMQDVGYKEKVLPADAKKRISIEAGITLGWERYIGSEGRAIGIDRFGASAPGPVVMEKMGFTIDHIVSVAMELVGKGQ
nr:transketolase [bacterium]